VVIKKIAGWTLPKPGAQRLGLLHNFPPLNNFPCKPSPQKAPVFAKKKKRKKKEIKNIYPRNLYDQASWATLPFLERCLELHRKSLLRMLGIIVAHPSEADVGSFYRSHEETSQ